MPMNEHIRPAKAEDASRIAEIFVTNYRVNFYPFFHNDSYYFGELNVLDTAAGYAEGSQALGNTFVYDDGVVKGFIRVKGQEVEKLFVRRHVHGIRRPRGDNALQGIQIMTAMVVIGTGGDGSKCQQYKRKD